MGKLRNFTLDTSGLERLIAHMEQLNLNVDAAIQRGLEEVGKKAARDTEAALDSKFLPAKGKFSRGQTRASIITDPKVQKDGLGYYVPIGFDFSKPGAGGFLIKGTPTMSPDPQLHKMYYKGSKWFNDLAQGLWSAVTMYIYENEK